MQEEILLEKIKNLSPERIVEVEDFVDFLAQGESHQFTRAAAKLSERSLQSVWDNEEDAAYDQL